jgi:hypothetical protein
MPTVNHVPSWKPKNRPPKMARMTPNPTQRRRAPRNEKSFRVVNATALSPMNPRAVTTAALEITPGALILANMSSGMKNSASATTYTVRAAYCATGETARWAAPVAIQLTRTNPPSTGSGPNLNIATAMGRASPDMKKNTSSAVKAATAPSRWL